jgi:hypothetical protein
MIMHPARSKHSNKTPFEMLNNIKAVPLSVSCDVKPFATELLLLCTTPVGKAMENESN